MAGRVGDVKQQDTAQYPHTCPDTGTIVVQSYSGGSIGGAVRLNHGQADVVINWSGGLHHAKKAEVMVFPCCSEKFSCLLPCFD